MSATISQHHERVPSEFIGKARQLRNAIAVDCRGINEHLKSAVRPVHARLLRNPHNPSVTQAHLDKLRSALEKCPGGKYRLGPMTFEGGCRKFSFSWHQLRAAYWSLDDWSEHEPGLLVSEISIGCDGVRVFGQDVRDHAVVGLHALGRWFQRSFTQDVADLLCNLKPLAFAEPSVARVPCRDGSWRCAPINGNADQGMLLRCMTYVPLG